MSDTNKLAVLNGFEYEVDKLIEAEESGMKLSLAIKTLYPQLPKASIPALAQKVKKHPYYIARKDIQTSIIAEKGPELQQNLLNIAFEGKSERNRLEATINALDRTYGNNKEEQSAVPTFTFSFNFGSNGTAPAVEKGPIIDVEREN